MTPERNPTGHLLDSERSVVSRMILVHILALRGFLTSLSRKCKGIRRQIIRMVACPLTSRSTAPVRR
jgi:hypothetical protein